MCRVERMGMCRVERMSMCLEERRGTLGGENWYVLGGECFYENFDSGKSRLKLLQILHTKFVVTNDLVSGSE